MSIQETNDIQMVSEESGSDPQATRTRITVMPAAEQDAESPFDPTDGEKAFEAVREKLEKIPPSEIRPVRISTPSLVSIGLVTAERFEEDRPYFENAFKPAVFDVTRYDDLADRAMAYWYLTIRVRQAINNTGPTDALIQEAKPLRAKLLKAALYLWEDHPELGPVVVAIRAGHSYLNKADDMGNLAQLFADHWSDAENQCGVTKEEVIKAQKLGARFLAAMGKENPKEILALKGLLKQAREYLRRGIEEVRAGAAFVFNNDDEMFARYPLLTNLNRKRRAEDKTEEPESEEEPFPETPEVEAPNSPVAEAPAAEAPAAEVSG